MSIENTTNGPVIGIEEIQKSFVNRTFEKSNRPPRIMVTDAMIDSRNGIEEVIKSEDSLGRSITCFSFAFSATVLIKKLLVTGYASHEAIRYFIGY